QGEAIRRRMGGRDHEEMETSRDGYNGVGVGGVGRVDGGVVGWALTAGVGGAAGGGGPGPGHGAGRRPHGRAAPAPALATGTGAVSGRPPPAHAVAAPPKFGKGGSPASVADSLPDPDPELADAGIVEPEVPDGGFFEDAPAPATVTPGATPTTKAGAAASPT